MGVEMKKRKISLIALDMDGTLLMSDKTIHPDTPGDIAYAAAQGIHMVYCSGRDIVELAPYTEALPQIRYGICTSGSIVYDFYEKKSVFRRGIPQETVLEIIRPEDLKELFRVNPIEIDMILQHLSRRLRMLTKDYEKACEEAASV